MTSCACNALLSQGKTSAELYELRGLARENLKDYRRARSTMILKRSPCDRAGCRCGSDGAGSNIT